MIRADLSVIPEQTSAAASLETAEDNLEVAKASLSQAIDNEPIVFEDAYQARLQADTETALEQEAIEEAERQEQARLDEEERIRLEE